MPADQPVSVKPRSRRLLVLVAILVLLLLITGFLGFKYFTGGSLDLSIINQRFRAATDTKDQPRPTPRPIGSGLQTYKFSHGSKVTGPRLQTVTLDPIDPQPDQTQTVTAVIKNDSPLETAQLIIETDNDVTIQELKLIKGDQQNGTWQAQLKLKDTYDYNYYIKFDLRSSTGNYQGGLRLRGI